MNVISRFICLIGRGHDFRLRPGRRTLCLECYHCGKRTEGITIEPPSHTDRKQRGESGRGDVPAISES